MTLDAFHANVPGLYPDVPEDVYHAHPAIGSSALKDALVSAATYRYWQDHPREQSPAMRLGTVVHAHLLEPERAAQVYGDAPERPPEADGRRAKGTPEREEYEAWMEQCRQFALVGTEDISAIRPQVEGMVASARAHPIVRRSVDHATGMEVTALWTDEPTGLTCKARIDALGPGYVVDLKTSADATPRGFASACRRYGYHVQVAHYLEGLHNVIGDAPPNHPEQSVLRQWYWTVIESKPPYLTAVYYPDPSIVELGYRQRRDALNLIAECTATATWPGLNPEPQVITYPEGAF